jgi:hypothetical protein
MTKTDQELRAIHARACAAVARVDWTLSPVVDAFWPLYLQAVLNLDKAPNRITAADSQDERAAWAQGVESVAKMLDQKADNYALEYGHDDMGAVSFGAGKHADAKLEYHSNLIELAEEVRAMKALAASPATATRKVAEPLTAAAQDVLIERQRQMSVEGWTPEHDDEHGPGALALAAAAYALDAGEALDSFAPANEQRAEPLFWPFSSEWWKPVNPRRSLTKAAALILAEIERIDRDPGDESGHHYTRGGDHA